MEDSKALIEEREEIVEADVEETFEPELSMQDLLDSEGLEIDLPKSGDIRTGMIASISSSEILISIGAKSEGIVSGKELSQIDSDILESYEVGLEIRVYVLNPEDRNGNLSLSISRAQEELDWELVETLKENDEFFEGVISGFNKGGLIVPIGMLRGFVPGSQISLTRRTSGSTPEQRWSQLVDESIKVGVVEVDRSRRRLILSERKALNETRETLKDRLLEELEVGSVRSGRVTSLANFGAFVNIDGADGLVHLSEVSWERIKHPKDVLSIGEEVETKIISIDREQKRIGLSIRQTQDNPWLGKVSDLKEGQLVEGNITHLTDFGAFARLGERDLEGLIHISELSTERIEHPKEIVKLGDSLTLRIIKIDREKFRIGLSLRKVDSGAYIDLDWKMAQEDFDKDVADDTVAEADEETAVVDADAEAPEAVVAEVETAKEEPAVEEVAAETEEEAVVAEVETAKEEPAVEEVVAETAEAPEAEVETAKEEPAVEEVVSETEAEAPEAEVESTQEEPAVEDVVAEVEEEAAVAEVEATKEEPVPEEEPAPEEEA
jgi:small subunit ribosomal protein S1